MKVRHLKLVKAISEEGNLTNAAETLNLSQSALSHQLRDLEEELDIAVFHRINKKMVLSRSGQVILSSAKKILDELDHVQREILKLTNGETGTIRLSTECYTSYHWLPPIIKELHKQFPEVEVEIKADSNKSLIDNLLNGKLDVALVHRPVKDSNIKYTHFLDDELIAIFHPDHPFKHKKMILPKDFNDQTLITHSRNFESSMLNQEVFRRYGTPPDNIIFAELTGATLELVKAKLGIAVMPYWMASHYLVTNELAHRPVTRKGLIRKWYTATLKEEGLPSYIDQFIALLASQKRTLLGCS